MTTSPPARRRLSSSPFHADPEPDVTLFEVDDLVSHDLYGLGRVLTASHGAVTVDFGQQVVRVPRPFPKLAKL